MVYKKYKSHKKRKGAPECNSSYVLHVIAYFSVHTPSNNIGKRNQLIILLSMMSDTSEEEINRRLALLPSVLQSLDRQVKVALVQNGCYETLRFPTTDERSWERLGEKCGFDVGTLNLVRNLLNPHQSQQGK